MEGFFSLVKTYFGDHGCWRKADTIVFESHDFYIVMSKFKLVLNTIECPFTQFDMTVYYDDMSQIRRCLCSVDIKVQDMGIEGVGLWSFRNYIKQFNYIEVDTMLTRLIMIPTVIC